MGRDAIYVHVHVLLTCLLALDLLLEIMFRLLFLVLFNNFAIEVFFCVVCIGSVCTGRLRNVEVECSTY
jgi:hypothetical protein